MDYDNLAASPITKAALENLLSDMEGPRIRLYRAVIGEDIRFRPDDEVKDDGDEDEADEDTDGNEDEAGDEDENDNFGDDYEDGDVDPRSKIDLGRHPMEYHVYEVWAEKHDGTLSYWIYSADYIVEDGDSTNTADGEATRAEAIQYVEEALSYEHAEEFDEDRADLDWSSKDADGNKTVDFPEDDVILGYWEDNESIVQRDEMTGRGEEWFSCVQV
jgi:hypothetical protein